MSGVSQFQTFDHGSPNVTLPSSSVPTPHIMLCGDYSSDQAPEEMLIRRPQYQRAQSESLHRHPNTVEQRMPFMPGSPSILGMETDDPFQSPAQIAQMFGFCRSCLSATANQTLCQACTDGWNIRLPMAQAWYRD